MHIPSNRSLTAVILWMAGALLSFSATALAIRALAPPLGVFDILALRNAAGVAMLLGLVGFRPSLRAQLRPRRMPEHGLRNVIHFAATAAWAAGVTLLPLATVFALEFTTPAWVALLAVLVLGERMTAARAVAIGLGFVGVLVILRPGLTGFSPAALLVLGAALGFALTTIVTKRLTATESTFAILLWMNAIQLPLNLIFGEGPAALAALDAAHLLPAAAVSLGGLFAHLCLTNAYRHGDAITVVPLDFLRVPLIAVVGAVFYAEPLDPFVIVGSLVMIAGILWNMRAELAAERAARVAPA